MQEVSRTYGMPVVSIRNLDDLLEYISQAGTNREPAKYKEAVAACRSRYGVT